MSYILSVQERKEFKSSSLHTIRENGGIPAVLYGNNHESKAIEVSLKDLHKAIQHVGRNGVIELHINNEKLNVMMTEYQYDSLKSEFVHADFLIVNLSKDIEADVSLVLVGEPKAVEHGGMLQQVLHEVSVTAKPNDIPEYIEVDIAQLDMNDAVTIKDIKAKISVKINHDDDEVIATILPPRLEDSLEQEQAVVETNAQLDE
ncbi:MULTISPECIES: 50S ribosomal protein L25/general stress protein Ctc [Bacillus]|uniref:50S ribosomal protein L25/general stress protein Ctc n=1 Tax=Bacillus TaxID=1386 RepID=UPI00030908E2|nr:MULTISPECIES: 50S ribosomal protein L25/general stress protein Ctc [Bacillus]